MSSPPRASGYFRTSYGEDLALLGTRLQRISLAIAAHRIDDPLLQTVELLVLRVNTVLYPLAQILFPVVAGFDGQAVLA